jgi:hypothetical protein
MAPAQQALHVCQSAIGHLRDLQAAYDIADEASHATKLQLTLQNLKAIIQDVAQLPRLPKTSWETLILKMKMVDVLKPSSSPATHVLPYDKQVHLHQGQPGWGGGRVGCNT